MPIVVPSQVVAFIDSLPPLTGTRLWDTSNLFGLADLLAEIPSELLTMDATGYASFICSKARIEETLSAWRGAATAGSNTQAFISPATESAIQGIRTTLAQCPDESA